MQPTLYTASSSGPGRVSIMAKPRGHDWLPDEMTALRAFGVDVLVCALTANELHDTGLADEPAVARGTGLDFVAIPIPDRRVPDLHTILPTPVSGSAQAQDRDRSATSRGRRRVPCGCSGSGFSRPRGGAH
ncbi:hypothetical protein [Nocardia brasiliensis]|uniref:hypothetical protein n=1 Tax=Nocardia brasiliensis TaxID=37326 RepID=UPI00366A75B7